MFRKCTRYAWLAGILDGEGTIEINRGRKSGWIGLQMVIINTSTELIERAKQYLESLGYSTCVWNYMPKPGQLGKKRVYHLSTGTWDTYRFVKETMPHLTAKRQRALDAISAFESQPLKHSMDIRRRRSIIQKKIWAKRRQNIIG